MDSSLQLATLAKAPGPRFPVWASEAFLPVSLAAVSAIYLLRWGGGFEADPQDLSFEVVTAVAALAGHLFVRKLRIASLTLGWGLLTAAAVMDVLDELQEGVLWQGLEGLVTAVAFPLMAIGLHSSYRALSAQLRRSRHAEQALRRSEERFFKAFSASPIPLVLYSDESAEVLEANPALWDLVGDTGTGIGRESPVLDALASAARTLREGSEVRNVESALRGASGATRSILLSAEPVTIGEQACVLAALNDISDRKELEQQLTHQAFHDSLTGLANRAFFHHRVEHSLESRGASSGETAVLFMDLDGFKKVNDSLGHATGDMLLGVIAQRLQHATRAGDLVARLGGDEFAALLEGLDGEAPAVAIAERIIRSLEAPVKLDGRTVSVGVSIGIAFARPGERATEALRNADLALYRAKDRGKGRYELFAPAMHAEALERLELEVDLRAAMADPEGGGLHLHYQPVVDLETGRAVGMEALVRWRHPRRGSVSPDALVPAAEQSGLIVPLGQWILAEACRQAAAWQQQGPGGRAAPLKISVNVSGRQLREPSFADEVAATLAATGLEPSCLVLEITESVLMQDTDEGVRVLTALRALGVRLAIDDFGTGFSSLSYLQRFPVDVLKIDKSFVDRVTAGGSDAALVHTILALCETLSLECVAEGIERPEQREYLRSLGCRSGQGYLFAPPMGPDEACRWIQAFPPLPAPAPARVAAVA